MCTSQADSFQVQDPGCSYDRSPGDLVLYKRCKSSCVFYTLYVVYLAACRYDRSPSDIVLYGQSVGSGPSVDLAARTRGLAGVILHSPLMSGACDCSAEGAPSCAFKWHMASHSAPVLSSSGIAASICPMF